MCATCLSVRGRTCPRRRCVLPCGLGTEESMRSRRSARDDLKLAVACLPRRTRVAMLEGIAANDIIVGAYTDRKGGVCPMLAAHRCGGRTDFLGFARAWDRFTHARRARLATERELAVLTAYLEASLLEDEGLELDRVIADHQAAARERRAREAASVGWAWTSRPERDAAAALEQLDDIARDARAPDSEALGSVV